MVLLQNFHLPKNPVSKIQNMLQWTARALPNDLASVVEGKLGQLAIICDRSMTISHKKKWTGGIS